MNSRWKNLFGWSKSKADTWERCKKQFFYEYAAQYEAEPLGAQAKSLKKLTKIPFLKGNLIHEAIAAEIQRRRQGQAVNPERAKAYARTRITEVTAQPKRFLSEAVNGLSVTAQLPKAEEEVIQEIETFFSSIWPRYEEWEVLYVDGEEDFSSFVYGTAKVFAEPDLVTKNPDGTCLVTDWKTGSEWEEPEESEELSAQILWVERRYKLLLPQITAEYVYLRTGQVRETRRTLEQMEKFVTRFIRSTSEMLQAENESDLPPTPSLKNCLDCKFATICEEGRPFLPSEPAVETTLLNS